MYYGELENRELEVDNFRTLFFKDSLTETIFFLFSESHFHINSSIYILYFTIDCG